MRLRENSRSANAAATFLPRMSCATRLSFCGLTRSMRATAFASFSGRSRSRFFLPMFASSTLRAAAGRTRARGGGTGGTLGLAIRRVAVERPRRRELPELVTDHLLGHQHRNVLLPVVDAEGQPDELRQDGRASAPDPDHFVPARRGRCLRLFEQIPVDERALPNRTRHDAVPCLLFLPSVAARNDELGGGFVLAGLLALGGEAPRRHRMAPARGAALAAAMRMVDRVHRHAAVVRHAPLPALASGLADRDVHVVGIRHRADRRHAAAMYQALLGRVEPQDHIFAVASDDLGVGAGRARDLPALADLDLDIVHDRADRNVARRHGIARLHVRMFAGNDSIALREPLRRQDVCELAVLVFDQRDESGAIGIIFDAFDLGGRVEPAALEIDHAVRALMPAAAEAHGDAAVVVAPAARMLALGQLLDGLAAIEARAVDQNQVTLARRNRVVGLECHAAAPYKPVVTSMVWPSSRVTTARLTSDCSPTVPLKALTLPLRMWVFTLLTFTSNSFSTASLICGLVACFATLNITWLCSEPSVAFSVMTGEMITS